MLALTWLSAEHQPTLSASWHFGDCYALCSKLTLVALCIFAIEREAADDYSSVLASFS